MKSYPGSGIVKINEDKTRLMLVGGVLLVEDFEEMGNYIFGVSNLINVKD